jgi:hypothetical protein
MKALLYSNTEIGDYTCQLPVILATGESVNEQVMVQEFSDSISLLMGGKWNSCTFHFWCDDESRHSVKGSDISFAEVIEAFCHGKADELSVDVPADNELGYATENWAVRDVPETPRVHLVKSVRSPAGAIEVPEIISCGDRHHCEHTMETIRNASCEHFDGGNGHWEYLGSEGEFVCYDIVEE